MNFLGHAYLSFENSELLLGNLMGDFIKGNVRHETHFTPEIRNGLLLHRYIDTFTDNHKGLQEAKEIFKPSYGLFSGAILDIVLDYFLANDIHLFSSENSHKIFVKNVHFQLSKQQDFFVEKFKPYFQSMIKYQWLYHIRFEEGLYKSFTGLTKRTQHVKEIDTAFKLFKEHKNKLEIYYQAFIIEMINFVKNEINQF